MPNWNIGITALVLSFLSATVYFQHEHNHELSRELTAAHHALDTADEQLNANRIAQEKAAELDRKYTQELANAESEINRLRNDVISGNKRLRIKAQCVPNISASSGVGVNSAIELSPAVGSTVLDIRSGIISDRAKIEYLQSYIKQLTHQ